MSLIFPPTGLLIARTVTLRPVATYELTAVMSTIYTVPSGKVFLSSFLHIVNASALPRTVQICVVPSAGVAAQANAILWDFIVPGNDFIELNPEDIWDTGVTLQGLASVANTVNVKLAGYETTQ